MYLLPLLLSNVRLGLDAPLTSQLAADASSSTLDKTGLARPEDIVSSAFDRFYPTLSLDQSLTDCYYKPWLNLLNNKQYVISTTTVDDDGFKIIVNVQNYKPEEINVKVVDRWVIIEAKHEATKEDGDVLSRQFVRKYLLPSRADGDKVTSTLSSDGILTVMAPLKPSDEKVIKIEETGQPAVSSKEVDSSKTSVSSNNQKEAETTGNNEAKEEATQIQEGESKPEKR